MRIVNLFPTPLIVAEISDASLCADLRETILAREAAAASVKHSNLGGWQSETDFFDWAGASGEKLATAVTQVADHYSGVRVDGAIAPGSVKWRVAGWANVNRCGDANATHFHPGAYWSAVFYVDDGGVAGESALGGAIEFSDPRGALPLMYAPDVKMSIPHCEAAGISEQFHPKTGALVMFPAWLPHRVTPYAGSSVRISVAMNFMVQN